MRKLITLLALGLSLVCCTNVVDDAIGTMEMDSSSQPLEISLMGGGWNGATWEHKACTYASGQVCLFPGRSINNDYIRYMSDTITWPPGFVGQTARGSAFAAWGDVKWSFFIVNCGVNECHNLEITPAETISGVLDPTKDILVSQVVQYACVDGTNLTEVGMIDNMTAMLCNRAVVGVDVGSFASWVNGWALSAEQRQLALAQLYTHIFGVTMGQGATSNVGTAMRDKFVRRAPTTFVQDYQKCVVDGLDYLAQPGKAVSLLTAVCDE